MFPSPSPPCPLDALQSPPADAGTYAPLRVSLLQYVLSIVIVSTCVSNGTSNWLQGSLLVTTYVLVAVACWYEDKGSGIGELPIPAA